MMRRLFNLATALSLMLCVAVSVLWIRNGSVGDTLILRHQRVGPPQGVLHFVQFWSSAGGLRVAVGRMRTIDPNHLMFERTEPRWAWGSYRPGPSPYPIDRTGRGSGVRFAGFELYALDHAIPSYDERLRSVTVPDVLLVAITAALPLVWIRRALAGPSPARQVACAGCGYDLRATPDRCPECGLISPAAAALGSKR